MCAISSFSHPISLSCYAQCRKQAGAGRLIEASPWSYLADMSTTHPPPIYGPPLQTQNGHHNLAVSGSFLSSASSVGGFASSTSPQSVPLPATPLSAALGPAAQATVPSTPASAYSDRFFAGDVFQRADTLLSMPAKRHIYIADELTVPSH